jgi:hypothetical protein
MKMFENDAPDNWVVEVLIVINLGIYIHQWVL